MLDVTRDRIVEGSITRALVLLSVPLVAQNLVQVANQVIDVFWLGRLSEDAVAGVGLVIPVIGILFALLFTGFVGTQVVVSQRIGREDDAGARRAAFNGALLALALGAVTGALVVASAPSIVDLLDPSAAVAAFAVPYLATYAIGLPVLFLADTAEAGLVGAGDSRGSLYLNAVAVGLNIVLDPFLIFGWGPFPALGVRGAAVATITGYAVGFLLAVALLLRGRNGLRITRRALVADYGTLREIVDVGLPNTGQRLGRQSARVVVIAIVSAVGGSAGLAAYTVGARVASVAFIPAQGLGQAAQSVVGQNLGASRPGRARRATWIGVAIGAGGLGLLGAVQWFVPALLTGVFMPDASPDAARLTGDYLRILAYGYPALGALYVLTAGFNGARRTRTSMVVSVLQYWAVRVPIAAVGLLLAMGVHAVFWAVTVSNVVAAIGAAVYYRYESDGGMLERAAAVASASDDDRADGTVDDRAGGSADDRPGGTDGALEDRADGAADE